MNKPMIAVLILAIAAVAGGGWYYWHTSTAPPSAAAPPEVPPPPVPEDTTPVHPLPEAGAAAFAPLPALKDSDPAIREALISVVGAATVMQYLVPENILRRIVVTVDNLARDKAPLEQRPVSAAPGTFRVAGDEQHAVLDVQNFARYRPMVAVVQSLDIEKLTALYVHFYPLLQRSYQDLGYPNAYFNDRLVQVIDVLLATPAPSGTVELVRPSVMYEFADPSLEARPAGQKLLIRMGPENAQVIKSKLMELRAAVTAAPVKH